MGTSASAHGWPRSSDRPFLVDRGDVGALARREHRSLEDAARTARYAFFERARGTLGRRRRRARTHQRRSGRDVSAAAAARRRFAAGSAAMHPRRDAIIRPLLECRRSELRRVPDGSGARRSSTTSRTTMSSIPRNRVRAELLPLLERFNPSIVDVLARRGRRSPGTSTHISPRPPRPCGAELVSPGWAAAPARRGPAEGRAAGARPARRSARHDGAGGKARSRVR